MVIQQPFDSQSVNSEVYDRDISLFSPNEDSLVSGRMQSPGFDQSQCANGSSTNNLQMSGRQFPTGPDVITTNYGRMNSQHPQYIQSNPSNNMNGRGRLWSNGYSPGGCCPSFSNFGPQYTYQSYGPSDMGDGGNRKTTTRESTNTLKTWLQEHNKNPYPSKGEKIMLAIVTKMTLTQVSTWFANARRRLKKENKMTWLPKNRSSDIAQKPSEMAAAEADEDQNNAANDPTNLDEVEVDGTSVQLLNTSGNHLPKSSESINISGWSPTNGELAYQADRISNDSRSNISSFKPDYHRNAFLEPSVENRQPPSMMSPSSARDTEDLRIVSDCRYPQNWTSNGHPITQFNSTVPNCINQNGSTDLFQTQFGNFSRPRIGQNEQYVDNCLYNPNRFAEVPFSANQFVPNSSILASDDMLGFHHQQQNTSFDCHRSERLTLPSAGSTCYAHDNFNAGIDHFDAICSPRRELFHDNSPHALMVSSSQQQICSVNSLDPRVGIQSGSLMDSTIPLSFAPESMATSAAATKSECPLSSPFYLPNQGSCDDYISSNFSGYSTSPPRDGAAEQSFAMTSHSQTISTSEDSQSEHLSPRLCRQNAEIPGNNSLLSELPVR